MPQDIGLGARPVGANGVEARLLDPMRNNTSDVGQTADTKKADAQRGETTDGFADYLNKTSVTTLEKKAEPTVFDPADAISAASVYGVPSDKVRI